MNKEKKILKIKSIIDSCQTYQQLRTCLSFVDGTFFQNDNLTKNKILTMIKAKANEMVDKNLTISKNNLFY
jgi:hypothetical protein